MFPGMWYSASVTNSQTNRLQDKQKTDAAELVEFADAKTISTYSKLLESRDLQLWLFLKAQEIRQIKLRGKGQ